MSGLLIALQRRDACNGSCETHAGCDCLRPQPDTVFADSSLSMAERLAIARGVHEEIERDAYRAGWRWGLVNGMFAGGIAVAAALYAGIHWFKG